MSNKQQQSMHATENKLTRISLVIVWMFIFCHVWKLIPTMYEVMEGSADAGKEVRYAFHYTILYGNTTEILDALFL